jgi:tRNA-dihydrouridine synthase A
MVTTGALIHGDRPRHLNFNVEEHPVALQLGGSDATDLATCAKLGQEWGYDEINLNCGCPSERVQRGSFGACLMAEPNLVADSVKAMVDATTIPITVKHRIGIDAVSEYGFVRDFVGTIADAGCKVFIAHARNAILKGLSPKENREIPPLKYEYVYQLKRDFPHLTIVINGGVATTTEIHSHLQHIDGVMIGREAYHNPYWLSTWDHAFFEGLISFCEREDIEAEMEEYISAQVAKDPGFHIHNVRRHMVGLYKGLPGARAWRRKITGNTIERVAQTLAAMEG